MDQQDGLYNFISGIDKQRTKISSKIAWELENIALRLGWPSKYIMGSENSLIERFKVSRETMREAIRILERRGAMKMLRGRYGGLSLIQPNVEQVCTYLLNYLNIIGYDGKHIVEAAHIFDRILIQWLIDHKVTLLPSSTAITLRSELAYASGESVFILYAATLDCISITRYSLEEHDEENSEESLREAISHHDLKKAERISSRFQIEVIEYSEIKTIKAGKLVTGAEKVAMKLIKHSQQHEGKENDYINSEWELSQIFNESRSMIRQGLRILQDADMLESRYGRTGGVKLKNPSPAGVIRQVFPFMAYEQKNIGSFSILIWEFNLAQLELAIMVLEELPSKKRDHICAEILNNLQTIDEPRRWIYLQQKIGEIAGNPLLDTILRCVVTYLTRSGQVPTPYPDKIAVQLLKYETSLIHSLNAVDLSAAITLEKKAHSLLMKL